MRGFLLLLLMFSVSFELACGGRFGGGFRGGGARFSSGGGTRFSSGGGFGSSRSFGSSGSFGSRSIDSSMGSRMIGSSMGSRMIGSSMGSRIIGSSSGSRIIGRSGIGGSRIIDNSGIGGSRIIGGSGIGGSRIIGGSRFGSRTSIGSRFGPRGSSSNNFGRNSGRFGYGNRYGFKRNKGKGPSFITPGYGTKWGTSFGKGSGKKSWLGKKKTLGLGVGAGFVGGAAIGGLATYGVYHRYNKYRDLMHRHRHGYGFGRGHQYDNDYGDGYADYYNNYYMRDRCFGGCPGFAQCRYGFCECPYGYTRRWGRCDTNWDTQTDTRPTNFNPLSKTCRGNQECWKYDLNLICNNNLTTAGTGRCECRRDMKWNAADAECQLYLDVDCSEITYETPPDPVILKAVNKTEAKIKAETENKANLNLLVPGDETDAAILNETAAIDLNTTLSNSLLSSIDPQTATENQIKEAYCRDVDSLSFEFQRARQTSGALTNSVSVVLCFQQFVFIYSLFK